MLSTTSKLAHSESGSARLGHSVLVLAQGNLGVHVTWSVTVSSTCRAQQMPLHTVWHAPSDRPSL